MRAPEKIGLAITFGLVACSAGDNREAAKPRDVSRALAPSEAPNVPVSPLEAGQAGKTKDAASNHRSPAQASPRKDAPPAAEAIPVAAASVGSIAATATVEPATEPQMSAMQAARTDPTAAPAPAAAGPSEHPAGNDAMGEGVDGQAPRRVGIVILRGGAGGIDDDCDELTHPGGRPNGGVLINTRAPNMGGSLGNPAGATAQTPRAGNPTSIGMGGMGNRAQGIRGGSGGGRTRMGGGMHR